MKSIIIALLLSLVIVAIRSASPVYNEVPNIDWTQHPMVYTSSPNTILTVDINGQLVKSTNSGKSFSVVTDVNGNKILSNADIISDGQSNDNILVLYSVKVGGQATTTKLSVSVDGGATFKITSINFQISAISVNPNDPMTLLGRSGGSIMISNDFGSTWNDVSNGHKLFKNIYNFYSSPEWDPMNGNSFFSILDNGQSTGVLSVTKDLGKTQKSILSGAMDMIYTKNYFYVAVLDSKAGTQLWVRSNYGPANVVNTDGFLLCEFPFGNEIQINDFRILDDTAGAIYLGIQVSPDGQSTTSVYGHVYVSNSLGNIFTLALKKVAVSSRGYYDFNPIKGAPGAYLFNGVSNVKITPDAPITVRSFITYDNGARWNRLTKPDDMDCTVVSKECFLNVHGLSAYLDLNRGYGPFYSIENAPGLILATGNANPALSSVPNVNRIKTVFSNDNGQTWRKIADFGSIYEFGAFGSSIIYATAMNDTNTIYYSFNQGLDSSSFQLKANYDVINIITNPQNSNNQFLLLVQDSNDNPKLIFVDLAPVQPAFCTGDQLQQITLNCVLGEKNTYSVIKPDAKCTLQEAPTNTNKQICECSVDDYECDIGFEPTTSMDDSSDSGSSSSSNNGTLSCKVDPDSRYVAVNEKTCTPGQTYTIQNGFRKVAGSKCIGGVSNIYQPKTAVCGEETKTKGKGWVAAVVIILVVVGIGGFGFYVYKNPDLKQKLKKMVGLSKETKYSVVGIKPNSLADDEFGIEDDDAQILNDNDLQEDSF